MNKPVENREQDGKQEPVGPPEGRSTAPIVAVLNGA